MFPPTKKKLRGKKEYKAKDQKKKKKRHERKFKSYNRSLWEDQYPSNNNWRKKSGKLKAGRKKFKEIKELFP